MHVDACTNWFRHFSEGVIGGERPLVDSSFQVGGSLTDYIANLLAESFDNWVNTLILQSAVEATLRNSDSVLLALRVSLHQFWG